MHGDLNDNHIRHIPKDTFRNVTSLTTLWLSKNNLTSQVFESVQHLSNLDQLDLNDNHIRHIPKDTFRNVTSLTTLWLSKNNLTSQVFESVQHLHNLKQLSLATNHIEKIPPFAFSNLSNLKSLSLARNRISELLNFTFANLTGLKQIIYFIPRCYLSNKLYNDNELKVASFIIRHIEFSKKMHVVKRFRRAFETLDKLRYDISSCQ
ncbi:leucine-rich repeat-containing G-protein coupled receptor 4 [Octopus bimaculoides]|uniref:leucine-rich repeat-containing G-protein coupled receptor 4 n=1 Tax=Octopus bimaculoides TaxID=37653 RepID=UPI0022E7A923|nr:leucine-rich repeat-containing G-protein coupled receptor 4 [Octopus bimaculoides]